MTSYHTQHILTVTFLSLLGLPAWGLMPLVVAISYLGVYAITHAAFDLMVMVGFGILGFVLRKLDFSLVPVVLGLLLGMDMENNLRRALSISGAPRRSARKRGWSAAR